MPSLLHLGRVRVQEAAPAQHWESRRRFSWVLILALNDCSLGQLTVRASGTGKKMGGSFDVPLGLPNRHENCYVNTILQLLL